MAAITFTSLQVSITLVGIDGLPKAATAIRPLRVVAPGMFGVVYHGKVVVVTPTSGNTGTASLTSPRMDPATCPVAKKSDLGLAAKAEPVAAAYAKTPDAQEPAKKPRTIAQLRATVSMCEANHAKAVASGDAAKMAQAAKAVTTAQAAVNAAETAAKPAKKSRKGTKESVTLTEAPAAKAMPTKAELMAQIEALSALLAAAK